MTASEPRTLRIWQRIVVYLGVLAVTVTAALYLDERFKIGKRSVYLVGAVLFVITATGRPWWLFDTIRRLRWFGLIESDRVMKAVLLALAAVLLLAGLLAPSDPL